MTLLPLDARRATKVILLISEGNVPFALRLFHALALEANQAGNEFFALLALAWLISKRPLVYFLRCPPSLNSNTKAGSA